MKERLTGLLRNHLVEVADAIKAKDLNVSDYLANDVLELRYEISSDFEYLGAILVLTVGGPHIELNTRTGQIYGTWGGTSETYYTSTPIELDEYLQECFDERRI